MTMTILIVGDKDLSNTEWLLCPICKNKTRIKLRYDTVLENFPLYCPKCKIETLICVKQFKALVITEPDALDAEPITR